MPAMPHLPDVDAVLEAHGIGPGPEGYDLAALAAAVEGRGWSYRTEELDPDHRGRDRYRALVFRRTGGLVATGYAATRSYRGRGRTEEEALARAVAGMLAREG